MINLKYKTVLITEGSRGIGEACVKIFASAGADVAFTYNIEKILADQLCTTLKSKSTLKAYAVNIPDEKEIRDVINSVISDFGKIDILVNNAGIWEKGEIENLSLQNWERTLNINLTGTFIFTRYIVPVMIKNKFGRIINVSSTAGQRGEAFYSHYAASKGGQLHLQNRWQMNLANIISR